MGKRQPRGTLTSRQLDVVKLVAAGCTDKEIGQRLGIAEGTVGDHVGRACAVVGARTRTHLVSICYQTNVLRVASRQTPISESVTGHWTQRAGDKLSGVVDRHGNTITTPVDRRWLWQAEQVLSTVARPGGALGRLLADLCQYLVETCEHHWEHDDTDDVYVPARRQCMWCSKTETAGDRERRTVGAGQTARRFGGAV